MEEHSEQISEQGIVRAGGEITPFNAGDAIAVMAEWAQRHQIPLVPSVKARIGKGAKALLDAHFPPQVVVLACMAALRTGWYSSVESLGQEVMVAGQGVRANRRQWQQYLESLAHQHEITDSTVWKVLREESQKRADALERRQS